MAEWNVWNVDLNGTSHTVSMKSPVFGKKTIKVNGDSTEVGSATTMWSNYDIDLDGTSAYIKFRAIKSTKGMSLFVNGEKVPLSVTNACGSAESVEKGMLIALIIAPPSRKIFGLITS